MVGEEEEVVGVLLLRSLEAVEVLPSGREQGVEAGGQRIAEGVEGALPCQQMEEGAGDPGWMVVPGSVSGALEGGDLGRGEGQGRPVVEGVLGRSDRHPAMEARDQIFPERPILRGENRDKAQILTIHPQPQLF